MSATDDGFYAQIATTLKFEGGYANDNNDPGGETNFGISKRAYPELDIANLTEQHATAIYFADYWRKPQLNELPPLIGAKVFDLGVNMGTATALRLLQRAVNSLRDDRVLVTDGQLGPRTLAAINGVDPIELVDEVRRQAEDRYHAIAASHPALARYLKGWLRRAAA